MVPQHITQNKGAIHGLSNGVKTIAAQENTFFPTQYKSYRTNSYSGHHAKFKRVVFLSWLLHGITGSIYTKPCLNAIVMDILLLRRSANSNLTVFLMVVADYRSELTGHPDSVQIRENQINARYKILFLPKH